MYALDSRQGHICSTSLNRSNTFAPLTPPCNLVQGSSADEAEAAQAEVEDEERVHGDSNAVFDHTTAPQNADACRQRPRDEDKVHGDSDHGRDAKGREECRNHQGEQRISYDADTLCEGAAVVC